MRGPRSARTKEIEARLDKVEEPSKKLRTDVGQRKKATRFWTSLYTSMLWQASVEDEEEEIREEELQESLKETLRSRL